MQIQKPKQGYKLVKSLFGKYEEIPKEWGFVKLDSVSNIQDGNWILDENYAKEGVRLLQVGDIGLGKFIDKSWKFISKETAKELKCKIIVQGNDILISRMPDPVGRACLSPNLPYDYIVAVDVSIVKPKKEIIVPTFLIQYINSRNNLDKIQKYVTGTTRQRISRKNLEQIDIILPPLPEQQKIATVLSNVDSLIQQTQKEIEKTQSLKKGLTQKLFTKGIKHTKFKEVKIGFSYMTENIPKEWNILQFSQISKKITDGEHISPDFVESGIPYISSRHVKSEISFEDCKFVSQETYEQITKRCNPEFNDLLITVKGTIGFCKRVDVNVNFVMDRNVGLIKSDTEIIDPIFLEEISNSRIIQRQIMTLTDNSVIPSFYLGSIEKIKIPIPSIVEQKNISLILTNISLEIKNKQRLKSKLENLKNGLMQKLLTGEIRVKV